MSPLLFSGYVLLGGVLAGVFRLINLQEAYKATCAMCDAEEEFIAWRLMNPGVYIGLSDKGKCLLGEWIKALDRFALTHPFVDVAKMRAFLISLFDDFPPDSPKSFPVSERPRALVFHDGYRILFP